MSKKKIKGFLFSIACARSIKQERKCLLRGQSFQVEGGVKKWQKQSKIQVASGSCIYVDERQRKTCDLNI